MPTFIKTGYWDKLSRAPKEYLNLDLLLSTVIPSQLGNSGKYLTTNGNSLNWASVDTLPLQAGNNGKYLITNGSVASWASVDTLPLQAGNAGKFLRTDGSTLSWVSVLNPNIYTENGTLTGNRTVTMNAFTLSFEKDLFINGLRVGASQGVYSTAFGVNALQSNAAVGNTAFGYDSLRSVINSTGNTAVGYNTLYSVINSGIFNTAIGSNALKELISGDSNVAIGSGVLLTATNASQNIFIGANAGNGLTTADYNTIIGGQLTGLGSTLSNNIILADGQGNIKYRWDGTTNTITGDLAITGVLRSTVTTNRRTVSYTLAIADRGKLVEMNVATANNLTVPLDSAVAFPVGTSIDISQYGAGQTTVVATGGVTIRSAGGALKLATQYSGASLVKIATNEWYLFGDITV